MPNGQKAGLGSPRTTSAQTAGTSSLDSVVEGPEVEHQPGSTLLSAVARGLNTQGQQPPPV